MLRYDSEKNLGVLSGNGNQGSASPLFLATKSTLEGRYGASLLDERMYFWMASCVHLSLKAIGRCTILVGRIWSLACHTPHTQAHPLEGRTVGDKWSTRQADKSST